MNKRLVCTMAAMMVCFWVTACGGDPVAANTITPDQFTPEKFESVQVGDEWLSVVNKLGQPFTYIQVGKDQKLYNFSKPKDKKKKYIAYDIRVGPDQKVAQLQRFSLYLD